MLVSVIIRTYNEEKYLEELLVSIIKQKLKNKKIEIVIVDSGSTDNTIKIAHRYGSRITYICKEEFTFGRSLNIGCQYSRGDILIFISGHCIPASEHWLENLVSPLTTGIAVYTYGRQIGRNTTKFSEQCLFDKYFPSYSKLPQEGFFCNNANAAIVRNVWEQFQFNESLTGLEDMELSKRLVENHKKIAYTADAPVYHIHDENWQRIKIRYEREAFALQKIIPNIHFDLLDFFRYTSAGISQDIATAKKQKLLRKNFRDIVLFRVMQYWGAYCGHHEHRKLSQDMKYRYFYPKDIEKEYYEKKSSCPLADESK